MDLYNILSINGIDIDEYLNGGGSSEEINEIKQNTYNLNTFVNNLTQSVPSNLLYFTSSPLDSYVYLTKYKTVVHNIDEYNSFTSTYFSSLTKYSLNRTWFDEEIESISNLYADSINDIYTDLNNIYSVYSINYDITSIYNNEISTKNTNATYGYFEKCFIKYDMHDISFITKLYNDIISTLPTDNTVYILGNFEINILKSISSSFSTMHDYLNFPNLNYITLSLTNLSIINLNLGIQSPFAKLTCTISHNTTFNVSTYLSFNGFQSGNISFANLYIENLYGSITVFKLTLNNCTIYTLNSLMMLRCTFEIYNTLSLIEGIASTIIDKLSFINNGYIVANYLYEYVHYNPKPKITLFDNTILPHNMNIHRIIQDNATVSTVNYNDISDITIELGFYGADISTINLFRSDYKVSKDLLCENCNIHSISFDNNIHDNRNLPQFSKCNISTLNVGFIMPHNYGVTSQIFINCTISTLIIDDINSGRLGELIGTYNALYVSLI